MIAVEILWAVLCLSIMGWTFWRFGKSVTEADHTIQRDRELAAYYGKIADNRRDELAAQSSDLAPVIRERDQLRAEVEEIERQTSFKAQFERKRLFLLSDRRTPEDREWHVPATLREGFGTIWHPAVTRSWILGRRIVIWAKSKELARRTVTARLPESSGFLIGEPIEGREFAMLARAAPVEMDTAGYETEDLAGDPVDPAIGDAPAAVSSEAPAEIADESVRSDMNSTLSGAAKPTK